MNFLVGPYGPQPVLNKKVYHLMTSINNDTYDIGLGEEKYIFPTVPINNDSNAVQPIEWEINSLNQTHTFFDFGNLYLSLDLRLGDKTKDNANPASDVVVSTINNTVLSLLKHINFRINGQLIESVEEYAFVIQVISIFGTKEELLDQVLQ